MLCFTKMFLCFNPTQGNEYTDAWMDTIEQFMFEEKHKIYNLCRFYPTLWKKINKTHRSCNHSNDWNKYFSMLFTAVLHRADHLFHYIKESNMKFQVLPLFFS